MIYMERSFKKILYENYSSTHNSYLYGDITKESIRKKFKAWDQYYKRHLPIDKSSLILDVGCGDGSFVYYLQTLGYSNVHGIDVSVEQISIGENLGISNLEVGDLVSYLTHAENGFHFIIARDVIEHFTRQETFQILLLVNKALKENGKFLMQVPNGQGLYYTSIFYGDFTHEMAYTSGSVRQLFLNTGFKQSICYPTGPVSHSLAGMLRKCLWQLKVSQLRFWKMVETGNSTGIFTSNIIAVGEK